MAKNQNTFAKRQREQMKKEKAQRKRERRQIRKEAGADLGNDPEVPEVNEPEQVATESRNADGNKDD